jgi:hypothetical protein
MRDYSITKYKGNTHYTVNVTDSYGRTSGSFFRTEIECWKFIYDFWSSETPLTNKEEEQNLLNKAIAECVQIDIKRGVEPKLD